MNDLLNQKLTGIIEKFEKMEMFHKIDDDESALEVLDTVTDEEIRILKSIGELFVTMADNIEKHKYADKEVKAEVSE